MRLLPTRQNLLFHSQHILPIIFPSIAIVILSTYLCHPHLDEYGTWWFTSGSFDEIFERTHAQGQAPLYYALQWLINYLWEPQAIEQMRIPSIIMLLIGFFFLSKTFLEWFGGGVACAAIAVVTSDILSEVVRIFFFLLARPYAFLWLIMSTSIYFQHRYLIKGKRWPFLFYSFLGVLLLATQQLYVFFLPYLLTIRLWSLPCYNYRRTRLDWCAPLVVGLSLILGVATAPIFAPHLIVEAHLISVSDPFTWGDLIDILTKTIAPLLFFLSLTVIGKLTIAKHSRPRYTEEIISLFIAFSLLITPLLLLYSFELFWKESFINIRYFMYYVFGGGIIVGTILRTIPSKVYIYIAAILYITIFCFEFVYTPEQASEESKLSLNNIIDNPLGKTLEEAVETLETFKIKKDSLKIFSNVGFIEEQTKFPHIDKKLENFLTAPLRYYGLNNATPIPYRCVSTETLTSYLTIPSQGDALIIGRIFKKNKKMLKGDKSCVQEFQALLINRGCKKLWSNYDTVNGPAFATLLQCS